METAGADPITDLIYLKKEMGVILEFLESEFKK